MKNQSPEFQQHKTEIRNTIASENGYLHNDDEKEKYRHFYDTIDGPIGGDAGMQRFMHVVQMFLKGVTGKHILEIGCGEGSLSKILKDFGNDVYGVDSSESGIKQTAAKGIPCSVVDVCTQDLLFRDDTFDIVIIEGTIEHLENPYKCLREAKRVLMKDGVLIISIPNPALKHSCYYPGLFELSNFKRFLSKNKFKIISMAAWGQGSKTNFVIRNLQDKSEKTKWENLVYKVVYYIVRKRNMFFRKLGTPLRFSHDIQFYCINHK